jgi:hypothetical protein
MNTAMKRTTSVTLLAILIAALLAPASAFAGPRPALGQRGLDGRAGLDGQVLSAGSETMLAAGATAETIRERVAAALARRAQRFEEAAGAIERRQNRLGELCDEVAELGGDVDGVRARLQTSRELLADAREQEAAAAELFRAVPDATNRRAAFLKARTQARRAVETLNHARLEMREAARMLREIARELGEGAVSQ